jgi:hypothetical protein
VIRSLLHPSSITHLQRLYVNTDWTSWLFVCSSGGWIIRGHHGNHHAGWNGRPSYLKWKWLKPVRSIWRELSKMYGLLPCGVRVWTSTLKNRLSAKGPKCNLNQQIIFLKVATGWVVRFRTVWSAR